MLFKHHFLVSHGRISLYYSLCSLNSSLKRATKGNPLSCWTKFIIISYPIKRDTTHSSFPIITCFISPFIIAEQKLLYFVGLMLSFDVFDIQCWSFTLSHITLECNVLFVCSWLFVYISMWMILEKIQTDYVYSHKWTGLLWYDNVWNTGAAIIIIMFKTISNCANVSQTGK